MQRLPARALLALLLAGLVAAVLGARAHVLFRYGSDLPYWDPWAREGDMMIAPHLEGTLDPGMFFVPHSEHRIAPTLALNLALVVAARQWDARVECLASAALAALVAAGMTAWTWRRISPQAAVAIALAWLGFNVVPLAWENVVFGFQSQFYFLIGFSLLAMGALLHERGPKSGWWWTGLIAAGLAMISMGSGFLAAAAVAGAAAFAALAERRASRRGLVTLLVASTVTALGWLWRADAPWHDSQHAQNVGEYLTYAVQCLAWPRPEWPWLAPALWAPWMVFVVRAALVREKPVSAPNQFIIAIGLWTLLQIAAVAYGRGAGGSLPSPRYGDVFAVGVVANLLALFANIGVPLERFSRALSVMWGLGLAAAVAVSALALPVTLEEIRQKFRAYESSVAAYVRTGDVDALMRGEVPFPDRAWLRRILDRPALRSVLPASVREPLQLEAAGAGGFAAGGISNATPPLTGLGFWGSHGVDEAAEWTSRPLPLREYAYLRFELSGMTAASGIVLQIETPGAAGPRFIAPTREPGESWRSAVVRVPPPGRPVILRAIDRDARGWLGFSAPVEVSAWSEAARWLCRHGRWFLAAGAVVFVAGAVAVLGRPRGPGLDAKL